MEKTAVTCVAWLPRGVCSGRLTALEAGKTEDVSEEYRDPDTTNGTGIYPTFHNPGSQRL